MKNLIIVLLFLFTSTSLFAVNKEFEKNDNEILTQVDNSELINKPIISTKSTTNLFKNESGNCIIDITIVNGDGEKIATIHVDTNTETTEECQNLSDAILDMAG
jgi:hypothetical protein